jgi:hypothetical protein
MPLGFLLQQLAQMWGVGFIDLKINDISPQALHALPEKFARAHTLIPFAIKERHLHVAMWNPRDLRALADIEQLSGRRVMPHLAAVRFAGRICFIKAISATCWNGLQRIKRKP